MGIKCACGLLLCAAKRCGAFPPNMPVGLRLSQAVERALLMLMHNKGSPLLYEIQNLMPFERTSMPIGRFDTGPVGLD